MLLDWLESDSSKLTELTPAAVRRELMEDSQEDWLDCKELVMTALWLLLDVSVLVVTGCGVCTASLSSLAKAQA